VTLCGMKRGRISGKELLVSLLVSTDSVTYNVAKNQQLSGFMGCPPRHQPSLLRSYGWQASPTNIDEAPP
jgi:hypothetical protein